jgi:hypothetical protein
MILGTVIVWDIADSLLVQRVTPRTTGLGSGPKIWYLLAVKP